MVWKNLGWSGQYMALKHPADGLKQPADGLQKKNKCKLNIKRKRFVNAKKHLDKLPSSLKNKPQVSLKLLDFCLIPLPSISFQSCFLHHQNHP